MKVISIQASAVSLRRRILSVAAILLVLLIPAGLFAQTDSAKAKEEPPAAEEPSLISPSIEFISVQKADSSVDLKATMKAKVKGSSIKLALLKVTFKLVTDSAEKDLGFVITDKVGKAVLNVKNENLLLDKEGKLHFKASFAGNKAMDAAEEEVSVKRARLVITPVKEDSTMSVQVKLVDLSTGKETPVPSATVGIFVKRMFNPLKVGEGTTDSSGEASVDFPANLPGDPKGNLTLMGKLDENETYGNLEASVAEPWGVPVSDKIEDQPRALWSSHPPLWMLITFIILMLAVWGHYIVIVYQLFSLRNEQPHAPTNATNN